MKKPSSMNDARRDDLRARLIGLGEHSVRKSYYPELQKQLEKLNERVELAELVAEIGRALIEGPDLQTSLQHCTEALEGRIDAAFVRIWTVDQNGEKLELQASSGLHGRTQGQGQHSRLSIRDYPYKIGIIAREGRPFLTNQVQDNPHFHNQDWVGRQKIVSFAGYPLRLRERLVGVVALFGQKPFNETVLVTLETVANQIAMGIDRLQALDAYRLALNNVRESHVKVNGILRSVADALLVIDHRQRILHMNQSAEALLGVALATAYQQPVSKVFHEPSLLEYLARIEQFMAEEEDIDLEMFDAGRNERRIIQARVARLVGVETDPGMVISLRDVTQDREVARLKSEFISTAAHELRTPLTTIMGFAELLGEGGIDEANRREYLGYIVDKAGTLEQIIDDLLDLSRIESGRGLALNASWWNLAGTLEKLIGRYRTEHPNYRFTGKWSADLGMVYADHGKILQVLDNLLSNAIKYSPEGTEISLFADRGEKSLTISVADQGIGMNEEQLARCFEKFYRADTSTTAIGGLGLGLSIVRTVVEAHQGEVWIESRPGAGTRVGFRLPVHQPPEENPFNPRQA